MTTNEFDRAVSVLQTVKSRVYAGDKALADIRDIFDARDTVLQ